MVKWSIIEANRDNTRFKVTTEEQGKEFLEACEEHSLQWMCGEEPTEFNGWKDRLKSKGFVLFQIDYSGKLTFGADHGGKKIMEFAEYAKFSEKDVVCSALDNLKKAFRDFNNVAHDPFCSGHGCSGGVLGDGSCALKHTEKYGGYTCLLCQGARLMEYLTAAVANHKWEKEEPGAKELTVAEISKMLGYEVKIVKE